MKFETSTSVSSEKIKEIEAKLRKAAIDSKNENFFGPNEKVELIVDPKYPSVDELSQKAASTAQPMGDPTLCGIAYGIVQKACSGEPICLALAAAAYKVCRDS